MNLPELLEKFARNEATPAEMDAFSAHLATLGREDYEQLLDTYGDIIHSAVVAAAPDKTLLASIQQHIRLHEKEKLSPGTSSVLTFPVKHRRWLYYGAAAAIIIACLTTALLLTDKKTAIIADVAQPIAIPPGGHKAVLTLANGQQILLDDARQGAVASQGNVHIIKVDKAVLAYQSSGAANKEVQYNTITTPRGGQYELVLPDGTHAWLNAASSLRFPVSFGGKERRVALKGEGYFAVAQDASHPFIVSFDNTDVEVLGTELNIKAYDDEPFNQSTLVSGRVRLIRGGHSVLLQPGKTGITRTETGSTRGGDESIKVADADIEQVTAWKNGKMALTNADLVTLMREISRWYDVDVHYTGPAPDKRFFGLINRNVYLGTILGYLRSNGVRISQQGRNITILP